MEIIRRIILILLKNVNRRNKWNLLVIKKKDTSNIVILPQSSKSGAVNFSEQSLNILTNKYLFNGLKGCNNMKKCESQYKYDSYFYNIIVNHDVKHRRI